MDEPSEALAEVFARWALRTNAPGIAWGLVRDGALVANGGVGTLRVGEDAPPDADSVFRIASMTKSFTGAALLSLVAEGRIRLDEPVATYVPELADWRGPTTDGPPLTVRHLVSMESGLPSDDAWADRHLDLPPAGMDALIAAGGSFTWTPGLRFEYSNLGWGLVGRVIERVAGVPVQTLVDERLLGPLGMSSTTWVRPATSNIAEPFSWVDERLGCRARAARGRHDRADGRALDDGDRPRAVGVVLLRRVPAARRPRRRPAAAVGPPRDATGASPRRCGGGSPAPRRPGPGAGLRLRDRARRHRRSAPRHRDRAQRRPPWIRLAHALDPRPRRGRRRRVQRHLRVHAGGVRRGARRVGGSRPAAGRRRAGRDAGPAGGRRPCGRAGQRLARRRGPGAVRRQRRRRRVVRTAGGGGGACGGPPWIARRWSRSTWTHRRAATSLPPEVSCGSSWS